MYCSREYQLTSRIWYLFWIGLFWYQKYVTVILCTDWSHIHVLMDIMECKVSPHSMYIESLYRVYCQPILSSNEKKHNQFAIHNNYLWKYPYIIKVIWIFWMGLIWYLKYVLLTIYKHGAISMSIWILWNVKCLHTTCRSILCIHIHVCILMDIMECRVLPHSMYIDSLYRVHCQPIISSNEKTHNQFAIDNNYLWKYPYIIKVIWNFAHESFLI